MVEKTKNLEFIKNLIFSISDIGKRHHPSIEIEKIEPFNHFLNSTKNLDLKALNKLDGPWSRREILSRYLLLKVVLDQGPDMEGVHELLKNVINDLYRKEIRIFHRPIDFFRELNISIDQILEKHETVKQLRSKIWAELNKTTPQKYNLFFAQSPRGIVSIKQVLDYGIHRWGVPLCLSLLLEKDLAAHNQSSSQPLVEFIESCSCAEDASKKIKNHERYGLGSAIGDKACHLFIKEYIHRFKLVSKKDNGWSVWSYELPFDSNAGRVLWRSGFFILLANLRFYEKQGVIQKGKGKGKTNYIRVTNFRKIKLKIPDKNFNESYKILLSEFFKIRRKSTKLIELQKIPNVILLNSEFGIGDFDDGLMYIGTKFCFNHENPNCNKCPLNKICVGKCKNKTLIENYRT